MVRSHRDAEAIAGLRRHLANNPDDMAAVEGMAKALRAQGEYGEAISFFERLSAHRKADNTANVLAPDNAAWQIDIACLYWLIENHSKAIHLMHDLVAGILNGSLKYGDAAGGMSQGLLLYYMATSTNASEEASFALEYLRNRIKGTFGQIWPCSVAQYYLGAIPFEAVMEGVNRQRSVPGLVEPAKIELARRRRLAVALFHDGVRSRAQDDEVRCIDRMRECYRLENPLIEQEWYLARYEVEKADKQLTAR